MESEPNGHVRIRNPKACQLCRQRKVKCDGNLPSCNICQQRGAKCEYRLLNRPRRSRKAILEWNGTRPNQLDGSPPDGSTYSDATSFPSKDFENHDIYQSVNGTQHTKQLFVQLYYGPSSNFAFVQHLYRAMMPVKLFSGSEPGAMNDFQGIEYFKQRGVFFGLEPAADPSREHLEGFGDLFLPFDKANEFLERFISTHHLVFPTPAPGEYERMLSTLYGSEDPQCDQLSAAQRGILLAALANGAATTSETRWADKLYEYASKEALTLDDVINLETVQLHFLLAYFQATVGRPSSAYLHLGKATLKAFGTGLHKDIEHRPNTSDIAKRAECRRVTFWALTFSQLWISLLLGRPSALHLATTSVPFPKHNVFILALGDMSKTIAKCAKNIYEDAHAPLPRLRNAANEIRLDLDSFKMRMEPILHFSFEGIIEDGQVSVEQLFITNFYAHTWIMTFRPFLLVHLSWQKSERNKRGKGPTTPLPSSMFWLLECCGFAVKYASAIIRFLEKSVDKNEIVQGLSFAGHYLECACYLLVYDSIRDPNATTEHITSLELALTYLNNIIDKSGVPATRHAVGQMLFGLKALRKAGPSESLPKTPSPLPPGSKPPLERTSSGLSAQAQAQLTPASTPPIQLPTHPSNNLPCIRMSPPKYASYTSASSAPNPVDSSSSYPLMSPSSFPFPYTGIPNLEPTSLFPLGDQMNAFPALPGMSDSQFGPLAGMALDGCMQTNTQEGDYGFNVFAPDLSSYFDHDFSMG
ncbi:hypothetical protein K402DRAFT_38949 [Aulographum hederae CBS 113979]|uniref:Zn(2)-C6 fungal-type domain-containing protein n=1 Tax=Aulographum hederae CBS 113979 TaxID=1176131 RepID=A0A6G1H4M2_9PEZI|nr:hypothetical protein K402DRAFT_38949 [Aulographum hederae CBS 113979]